MYIPRYIHNNIQLSNLRMKTVEEKILLVLEKKNCTRTIYGPIKHTWRVENEKKRRHSENQILLPA